MRKREVIELRYRIDYAGWSCTSNDHQQGTIVKRDCENASESKSMAWLREHMHESIPDTVEKLNKKLVGHYQYYGIYGNWISLKKFYSYVKYELWRTKRRRDQSCWLTWEKFKGIMRIYPIAWPRVYLTSAY